MVEIIEKKLKNGLPIIFIQNKSLNSVVVDLFVGCGSAYEIKNNNGISHLIEQLVFYNRTSKEMEEFFPLNLEITAWTRKDFTCYEIFHYKDYLAEIIKLLFNFINKSDFNSEILSKEKEIVAQEINEKNEEPFTVLGEEIDNFLHNNSSLSLSVLGSKTSIKKISLSEIKKWYDKFYCPANMVLSISGNFDIDESYKIVENEFSKLPQGKTNKVKTLPVAEYNNKKKKDLVKDKKFDQDYIGIVFPAPDNIGGDNYFKYLLLADILSRKLNLLRKNESDFMI